MPQLIFVLLLALGPTAAAFGAPIQATEWRGEYFDKKAGAIYVRSVAKGFRGSKTKYLASPLEITILNILKKETYVFPLAMERTDEQPSKVWRLPAGKFEVTRVVAVDPSGQQRTWAPEEDKGRKFVVKRQSISNLGIWTLSPSGKKDLEVAFDMAPNTYEEGGKKKESSVARIIDGFTGLTQETFAGKKVKDMAEKDYSAKDQARSVIKTTRNIAMFYTLNLFKHNYNAKKVATVLNVADPALRGCYSDRLEWAEKLAGEVRFTFLLSKKTKSMDKLKFTSGTVNDDKLVECLYVQLSQLQFPIEDNMIGELAYTFDVK